MTPLRRSFATALPVIRSCLVSAVLAALIGGASAPVGASEAGPGLGVGNGRQSLELAQAQSSVAPAADEDVNDPLEPVNRAIFAFNEFFLEFVLSPVSQAYEAVFPSIVREGIRNVLFNLATPVVLANDILQGEPQRAMETLGRAVVNTVAGMGGVIDIGAELGVRRHNEDFGQTLGVWGVPEMFYIVIPILGPSNPRDAVGKLVVDSYFDPLGLWLNNTDREGEKWARLGMKGVDEYSNVRSDLDQIRKTSIDYYAAIRSLYRQKRAAEISNGRDIKLPPIPDLGSLEPDIAAPDVPEAAISAPPADANAAGGRDPQISYRLVHPSLVPATDAARE